MELKKISPRITVSPQITIEDVEALAEKLDRVTKEKSMQADADNADRDGAG